ncbi:MAG: cold shock domain-containing protein [Myxococcota bacterium]
MLNLDEVEPGAACTHKNTGLRYTVVEVEESEILLEAETSGHEPLTVKTELFLTEFAIGGYSGARRSGRRGGRPGARRSGPVTSAPTGPKSRGRIKKMVRDRGFGFIRGEDGKEVFFHRSGMAGSDYDSVSEGDAVEYVIQEGPRGARAEHVRTVSQDSAA